MVGLHHGQHQRLDARALLVCSLFARALFARALLNWRKYRSKDSLQDYMPVPLAQLIAKLKWDGYILGHLSENRLKPRHTLRATEGMIGNHEQVATAMQAKRGHSRIKSISSKLHSAERRRTVGEGVRDYIRRRIEAHTQHLPLLHYGVEFRHHILLMDCSGRGFMQEEHVHVIGAKLPQACLQGLPQTSHSELAERSVASSRIVASFIAVDQAANSRHPQGGSYGRNCDALEPTESLRKQAEFGCDHGLFPLAAQKFSKHRLGFAIPITARRIEECDALIPRGMHGTQGGGTAYTAQHRSAAESQNGCAGLAA